MNRQLRLVSGGKVTDLPITPGTSAMVTLHAHDGLVIGAMDERTSAFLQAYATAASQPGFNDGTSTEDDDEVVVSISNSPEDGSPVAEDETPDSEERHVHVELEHDLRPPPVEEKQYKPSAFDCDLHGHHFHECVCPPSQMKMPEIVSTGPDIIRGGFQAGAFIRPKQLGRGAEKMFKGLKLVPSFLKDREEFRTFPALLAASNAVLTWPTIEPTRLEAICRARALITQIRRDPSTYRFWRSLQPANDAFGRRVGRYNRTIDWSSPAKWGQGRDDPRAFFGYNEFINESCRAHMENVLVRSVVPFPYKYIENVVVMLVVAEFGPGVWSHLLPSNAMHGLFSIPNDRDPINNFITFMRDMIRHDNQMTTRAKYSWLLRIIEIAYASIVGVIYDIELLALIEMEVTSFGTSDPARDAKIIRRAMLWLDAPASLSLSGGAIGTASGGEC